MADPFSRYMQEDEHYEQIKFALEDKNVKNLAILGAFGSGI